MPITTRCHRCGAEFDADRAAILDGPKVWKVCPACRDPNPPGGPAHETLVPRRTPTARTGVLGNG